MGGGGEVRRNGYMRVVSSGHINKFINRLVARNWINAVGVAHIYNPQHIASLLIDVCCVSRRGA